MKQTDKLIQSRLKDFEVDVPEAIWGGIERRLPGAGRVVPLWKRAAFRYAAGIAALAACALTFYLLSPRPAEPVVAAAENQTLLPDSHTAPAAADETPAYRGADAAPAATPRATNNTASIYSPAAASQPAAQMPTEYAANDAGEVAPTAAQSGRENAPGTTDASTDVAPSRNTAPANTSATRYAEAAPTARKRESGGYAVGLVASNALSSSGNAPDTRHTRSQMYYAGYENQPLKYNHKIPFSFGITVEKQFARHWGIESGIVYTLLRSDYRTDNLIREGRQELHYIGVPLFARYRFYSTRHFRFYASAGPRMDFNIYGRRTDRSESPTANSTNTENIRDRRVQWSAHIKAGASYVFNTHFELYAEPAVSYFIDNGNDDIANLWKEKPVTFSFLLGIRTTF